MSCEDFENLIGRYHDDELSGADDRARVEAHLRECPSCAAYLARLRALSRMFDTLDLPRPTPDVLSALRDLPERQRELIVLRLSRHVAVAAIVLLVGSLAVLSRADRTGAPSVQAAGNAGVNPMVASLIDVPNDPSLALAQWVVTDLESEGGGG